VLVDAKNIGPSKWWSTLVKDLTAAGFSYSKTQKGFIADQLKNTQLIGIDMPGIFHLKTRVFAYPDPATGEIKETLLTGSYNPETAASNNDESLHRITDQHVVDQYQRAVAAMRDGQPVWNTWDPNCPVNAIFTAPSAQGPRPIDKIVELVKNEKELIALSVFTLRDLTASDKSKLIAELQAAKARGVPVVVITDRKQSDSVDSHGNPVPGNDNDKTDEKLQAAGIPVYECINPAGDFNAMHLKSGIFGLSNIKVVTDAGNWTYSAMGSGASGFSMNCESLLFIESGKLDQNQTGERYLAEFMRVLRKYGDQNPDQPAVEQTIAQLQKLPNWPTVKVDFNVVAKTHFGQDVYIVGNTEELGGWGENGPGLKLETDASTYPNWRSATVEVPLGTRFEYKVVKRNADGKLEWEPGQNAVLIADPIKDANHDRVHVDDAFG
jgi:hypothetical protein